MSLLSPVVWALVAGHGSEIFYQVHDVEFKVVFIVVWTLVAGHGFDTFMRCVNRM